MHGNLGLGRMSSNVSLDTVTTAPEWNETPAVDGSDEEDSVPLVNPLNKKGKKMMKVISVVEVLVQK